MVCIGVSASSGEGTNGLTMVVPGLYFIMSSCMALNPRSSDLSGSSSQTSNLLQLHLGLDDGVTCEILHSEGAVLKCLNRMCPGRRFADNAIFITVASILKVFEIAHARDNNGKEIAVNPSFTSGLLS